MITVTNRCIVFFFFSSRRRHTRFDCDWSSDVCSSDLNQHQPARIFGKFGDDRRQAQLLQGQNLVGNQTQRGGQVAALDRKSVVWGKSVDLGGRRIIKKKKKTDKMIELKS